MQGEVGIRAKQLVVVSYQTISQCQQGRPSRLDFLEYCDVIVGRCTKSYPYDVNLRLRYFSKWVERIGRKSIRRRIVEHRLVPNAERNGFALIAPKDVIVLCRPRGEKRAILLKPVQYCIVGSLAIWVSYPKHDSPCIMSGKTGHTSHNFS